MAKVLDMRIPLPPLAVQKEIVRILDGFTGLIDVLTAEQTARQKQYEHYRDKLLIFDDEVEWKPLGEVCRRRKGTNITAGQMRNIESTNGGIRVFAAGSTVVDVEEGSIPDKDVIRETGIVVKARGYIDFEYCTRPFSHKNELWSYTALSDDVDLRYLYHYLKTRLRA